MNSVKFFQWFLKTKCSQPEITYNSRSRHCILEPWLTCRCLTHTDGCIWRCQINLHFPFISFNCKWCGNVMPVIIWLLFVVATFIDPPLSGWPKLSARSDRWVSVHGVWLCFGNRCVSLDVFKKSQHGSRSRRCPFNYTRFCFISRNWEILEFLHQDHSRKLIKLL